MYEENYNIWLNGVERKEYKDKIENTADVVIIGGGITGVMSAYLLSKTGKKIILLERRKLGENVTDCTTGFLTEIIDIEPEKAIFLYGLEQTEKIFESHRNAIDNIEKIIKEEKISCDFERCPSFIYANSKNECKKLKKRYETYKKIGLNVKYNKDLKLNNLDSIEIQDQAKFHIMKFLSPLAEISNKKGVIISENTKVISIEKKDNLINVYLENGQNIKTENVIVATHTPFNKPGFAKNKYNLYRSYVLEYKIPKDILPYATYEDTLKPYNYFRIDKINDHDRLIIGGNDNLDIIKAEKETCFKNMDKYAKGIFKNHHIEKMSNWSGLIAEPMGGIAFIGESEPNIYYAFGFSGNGLTYSYIAGEIFTDNIMNKKNQYERLYKIKRQIPFWKKILLY